MRVWLVPLALWAVPASAQRAAENAVLEAEDAFGTSIGRETIGLYSASSVRGFSPTRAGNIRIDGLVFDQVWGLTNRIRVSTAIRVGISAIGTPFPAPTGIVDYALRRPSDRAQLSVLTGADSYEKGYVEVDAPCPCLTPCRWGWAARPFDPVKFRRFLNISWPGVVRSKGHFWLATRPDWVGEMSQAGSQVTSQGLGRWWAAVPKNRWPDGDTFERLVRAKWDPVWGDRRQELVFIGIGMDRAWIERKLNQCLVREKAFTPALWASLPDPFPAWGLEAEAA
jgi:hypothetical protein